MQLIIMRHAEAAAPFSNQPDADRLLTAHGEGQAKAAGQCVRELGFQPDRVWVSPYRRTQQTCDIVLQSLVSSEPAYTAYDSHLSRVTQSFLTPDSQASSVITAVDAAQQAGDPPGQLLLISHQPLLSYLLASLTGMDVYAVPSMAPASMVMLEAEYITAGLCELRWHRHSPNFDALM